MCPNEPNLDHPPTARRQWRVVGQVQGVGFRPFVYRLAHEYGLTGFVRNDTSGVLIEAQGPVVRLDEFGSSLECRPPALAVIRNVACKAIPLSEDQREFEIVASKSESAINAEVTVDTAVCGQCVAELLDKANRRAGYGLINCTNCGPRFTIIRKIPYDRPNTTMAGFEMCPDCRREYTSPDDRRFDAQPVACHVCGPKVSLVDTQGKPIAGDPIAQAVNRLAQGQILAIKGLGGFHLAVRADDETAVGRLRSLKHRDSKPFALMCRDIPAARKLVHLSESAQRAMQSPACPIVLARRIDQEAIAPSAAPGNHRLGVMLPYTPIQHLLFHQPQCPDYLVMTSANLSDEPLVTDNQEAVDRLGGICDAILCHDRPIERPVDDSVMIDVGGADDLLPLRRARGYVPSPIMLPRSGDTAGLCVGGELKNTVAVVRGSRAILSHHMGDLNHAQGYANFRRAIRDMCDLFAIQPAWIAHDLHPMYLSTVAAKELAREMGIPVLGIQHHHAHAAAVLAEHGETGPALAVVCDGVGYGTDATMWGGELLVADLKTYKRVGHLKPLRLAGGDAAAKDCRRCAMALLYEAFGDQFSQHPAAAKLFPDQQERDFLAHMIRRNFMCAASSGAGRVFDGVAALLNVCLHNTHEAEAAMRLESLAAELGETRAAQNLYQIIHDGEMLRIDLSPLVRELVRRSADGAAASELAALFHDEFARAWVAAVLKMSKSLSLKVVGLSGGVFCNERLTQRLVAGLQQHGLRVLRHRMVPPNDGGLSLGQAAIAAAQMADVSQAHSPPKGEGEAESRR